jgi:transposase-like protein
MKEHKNAYPIMMMARLLNVSVSEFYDWLKKSGITFEWQKEKYGNPSDSF